MTAANAKQAAGERAAKLVTDGMVVGLGTGTTARWFIDALGRRVRNDGLRISAVATSVASGEQARELGIPLLDRVTSIDLTVDGADEIDPALNLVKGLGGALLREKVVAAASRRMVVVATEDKLVPRLGRGPLPVEIVSFLWETTAAQLIAAGLAPVRRMQGEQPFITDNGNWILHCRVPPRRRSIARLATDLDAVPGVVGHGLFRGMASMALIADDAGGVRELLPTG
jgi:ribose 5-phosphate isomerase A